MNPYLCVYCSAVVLVILTTPAVLWYAGRIGAVDQPGLRTVHMRPVPGIGGVAIFLSTVSPTIATLLLNKSIGDAFRARPVPLLTLLGSATLVFAVGLVDDLKDLSARTKLLAELLAATVLCLVGIRISAIALSDQWTLSLGGWGYALTILWIVGITNAVNLSDGLDGLAAGICSAACGVVALFALHSGNTLAGVLMLALLGSLCGFLMFNFHPAKIFMGDCGSLFLGFLIAATSVMCVSESKVWVGLAWPALALGIPIFDTLFSMLRRFLDRRSLFAPDHGHFHHRLLEMGLNHRCAVLTIYGMTFLTTSLGSLMWVCNRVSSWIVFGGTLLLIVLVFRVARVIQVREILTRLRQKYQSCRSKQDEQRVFEDRQLQFQQVRDAAQWWQAVCQTAHQMDFAWVSLKTTYQDGRVEEELWKVSPAKAGWSGIITVAIPLNHGDGHVGTSRQLEVAICTDGSVESAARRATLFGRLIDEYGTRAEIQNQTSEIRDGKRGGPKIGPTALSPA